VTFSRIFSSAVALALPLALAGCSLFPTTRHLPVPKAPVVVQTVTPEQLVAQLDQHWASLKTLTAKVMIQVSVDKPNVGLETTMPTFPASILLRSPQMVRVYGRVPVLGTEMFDMASDGKDFTVYIPSKKEAVKGSDVLKKRSSNPIENLRPDFFFDAMIVRGLESNDVYMVTADSETIEDFSKKHLLLKPEYILNIMEPRPDSRRQTPVRVVTFDRSTMLPYEQDVYDSDGTLETQVFYTAYRDFDSVKYPTTITIKRPLDHAQTVLTVESIVENQTLKDDQFQVNYPQDTQIKTLN
jgi:outer membrane lipoprotein-sorting protein